MNQAMSYIKFIASGIRNKPGRNLATLFCFAFIAANVFSGQFLIAGAAGGVDRGVSRMGADHLVVPSEYTVFLRGAGPDNTIAIVMVEPSDYRIRANIMEKLGNITGISVMSPQLFVTTLNLPELSVDPVYIYGFDPETDFTLQPWLQKPLDIPLRSGEVIVGQGISGNAGTRISVGCQSYIIAGRLDPTRSSIDHAVFLRLDDAYTLAATEGIVSPPARLIVPGDVNAVLVRDAPGENQNVVTTRIKRELSTSPEWTYISVIGRHFSLDPVEEDIRAIPGLLNMISAFVVIISFPLIALIAAMVVHERQREIGILKSMGAKRNVIFFLIIAESLFLAMAGGVIGIFVSLFTLFVMNSQGVFNSALQVSFRVPTLIETGLMAGLALSVVITIGSISALWPAYQSSAMNPYEAIRRGE